MTNFWIGTGGSTWDVTQTLVSVLTPIGLVFAGGLGKRKSIAANFIVENN